MRRRTAVMNKYKGVLNSFVLPSPHLAESLVKSFQSPVDSNFKIVISRSTSKLSFPRLKADFRRDISVQPSDRSKQTHWTMRKETSSILHEKKQLCYNFKGFKKEAGEPLNRPQHCPELKLSSTTSLRDIKRRVVLISLSYLKHKKYSLESLSLIDTVAAKVSNVPAPKLIDKIQIIGEYMANQHHFLNLKENLLCYESSALTSQFGALLAFLVNECNFE